MVEVSCSASRPAQCAAISLRHPLESEANFGSCPQHTQNTHVYTTCSCAYTTHLQVTDWGSGEQSELGELKVKKSEILFGATAKAQTQPAASNADQASSASEASSDASTSGRSEEAGAPSAGQAQRRRPPSAFDQLCREIAMAEVRVLCITRTGGTP